MKKVSAALMSVFLVAATAVEAGGQIRAGKPKPYWLNTKDSGSATKLEKVGSFKDKFYLVTLDPALQKTSIQSLSPEEAKQTVGKAKIEKISDKSVEGYFLGERGKFCEPKGQQLTLEINHNGGYVVKCDNVYAFGSSN